MGSLTTTATCGYGNQGAKTHKPAYKVSVKTRSGRWACETEVCGIHLARHVDQFADDDGDPIEFKIERLPK